MINVVCYCGRAYSFEGAVGSCPQCGEPAFFSRGPDPEPQDRQEMVDKIVAQVLRASLPGELAA